MSNMSDLTLLSVVVGWDHIVMSDIESTVRAMCHVLRIAQIFVLEICTTILVVLSTAQTYTAGFS